MAGEKMISESEKRGQVIPLRTQKKTEKEVGCPNRLRKLNRGGVVKASAMYSYPEGIVSGSLGCL